MLILTRKPGQRVYIDLMEDLDPSTPIGDVFCYGPIEVVIACIRGHDVRLGLNADPRLRILRAELWAKRRGRIVDTAG